MQSFKLYMLAALSTGLIACGGDGQRGPQGLQGEQGLQGPQGETGQQAPVATEGKYRD